MSTMRFQSYFNHALTIIDGYDGSLPLSHHLKQYFAAHKKHGSTDRKMIAHACYAYYRLGHALKDQPPPARLRAALFLCTDDPSKWSMAYGEGEGWRLEAGLELTERIALLKEVNPFFRVEDIFPWKEELSKDIDHTSFCLSFLRQPDLFIRIRPGHEQEVMQKLKGQPVEYIPPFTLRLPNGFKTEEFFTPDKEIVVQDYSSQRLAPFLQIPDHSTPRPGPGAPLSVWDACAASGGKSLLTYDLNAGFDLTVSDIRESILHNLARRFHTAGIKDYHSFVVDLTRPRALDPGNPAHHNLLASSKAVPPSFDLIIADVPCTGSGTWSRNPEELFFFDPAKINGYRKLQEKILSNLTPHLNKQASLVYSTCSVFKKENEGMAAFINEALGLPFDRVEVIKGFDDRADTMFAARFIS